MVTIEDIEAWIKENGDSEGFYDTEALVNHFVNVSKAELIEKACEWLEYNFNMPNDFKEHFTKAMMEE